MLTTAARSPPAGVSWVPRRLIYLPANQFASSCCAAALLTLHVHRGSQLNTVLSFYRPLEAPLAGLRPTRLSPRPRWHGAGPRWSSAGLRVGAEPPRAPAAAARAADDTCWPCRAPVTGRSLARATLIFDRFDGTRASWRAVVVDGSAAGVLEPRRSCWCSPQQLPRPHAPTGWSQAVAGGRRMPYRANLRGPPRRQSYWRVRLRPVARQGPHHCGSRRCEPGGC